LAVTGRLSGPIFTREARFAYPLSFFWLAQIYATFVGHTSARIAILPICFGHIDRWQLRRRGGCGSSRNSFAV